MIARSLSMFAAVCAAAALGLSSGTAVARGGGGHGGGGHGGGGHGGGGHGGGMHGGAAFHGGGAAFHGGGATFHGGGAAFRGGGAAFHGGGAAFHGGGAAFRGGSFHDGRFHDGRFHDGRFFGGVGFGLGYPGYGYNYWPGYSVYDYAPSYYGGYYDTYPNYDIYPSYPDSPNYYSAPADDLMPYASGVGPAVTYGGSGQPAPVQDDTAHIRLTVPENAKVWFGDSATRQEGTVRDFVSPPLRPGQEYTYNVKATWRDKDGKEITRTRQVEVRSGMQTAVDLTR